MTPVMFEDVLEPADVITEDSGCAKYVEISDDRESGLFVRLHSWDDSDGTPTHPDFDALIGKRVRVTIEVLEA